MRTRTGSQAVRPISGDTTTIGRRNDDLYLSRVAFAPLVPGILAVLRQNSVRHQVIDLAGLIQRKFPFDGHPPAPPAATASPPLRRSPPCRPGEPGLAPPARRLQEDGDSAEGAQERPPLLGRAVEGVGGLEAGSRHRVAQHGPAVAAPPLPRVLGHTLRPAHRGPPPPSMLRSRLSSHGWLRPIRCGAPREFTGNFSGWGSPSPSAPSLGSYRSGAPGHLRPGGRSSPTMSAIWSPSISSRCQPRACACSLFSSCSLTIAGASSTST